MKIGVYSPYLHILGGGERYILTITDILSRKHDVDLFSEEKLRFRIKKSLNISLERVHFLPSTPIQKQNLLKKYLFIRRYDAFIYMTDGSLMFPWAKRNFLIIQSPTHIPQITFMNSLKLKSWKILCYSLFMKKIVTERLQMNVNVLSPCISVESYQKSDLPKENIILTVGRFFQFPHNKRHDVLIQFFKKFYRKYLLGWKLIIAGAATEVSGNEILQKLRKDIEGYPIEIYVNLSFTQLSDLYRKSKIYWHAAGYGQAVDKFPERAEHFGITTLEAMAAGAVPIAFKGGGQVDIITDGKNGYLWKSEEEFISKTKLLVYDEILRRQLAQKAFLSVQKYSCSTFYEKLEKIITG